MRIVDIFKEKKSFWQFSNQWHPPCQASVITDTSLRKNYGGSYSRSSWEKGGKWVKKAFLPLCNNWSKCRSLLKTKQSAASKWTAMFEPGQRVKPPFQISGEKMWVVVTFTVDWDYVIGYSYTPETASGLCSWLDNLSLWGFFPCLQWMSFAKSYL